MVSYIGIGKIILPVATHGHHASLRKKGVNGLLHYMPYNLVIKKALHGFFNLGFLI